MDIGYFKKYEPLFKTYYIKKFLGEGSFGKVFLIERESFGQKYSAALKLITIPQSKRDLENKLSYMTEANVRSYYEDIVNGIVSEFHLMSKLKGNSHIVSYEDHDVILHDGEIGWDILIRMELLTPLPQHTDLQKISPKEVVKLGIDICKALEKCQKEDIIHRDIKPENIFVSADGDYKLGDFGVARTIEKTTGDFTRIGTPPYMAPEIHSGSQYASCIDIYSLGLVIYRLLNKNRMPFLPAYPQKMEPGDEETATARRIKGDEIPPPLNADKKLAEVVLKACAFKPQDRYQNPADLRSDLEAILRENASELNEAIPDTNATENEKTSGIEETPYEPAAVSSKTELLMNSDSALEPKSSKVINKVQVTPPAQKKRVKIGFILCPKCGAEIRRDSISCISCRSQLRSI
ncbi:MAG: serine/threonine-protein kinase [Oscillospiraceae bacterium]|nr:serine/threonine-protein kinase [Oscillospiraceae bacterium]